MPRCYRTNIIAENAGLTPARVFCGPFMTSLNAPGFSLTLLNLTHIATSVSSVTELLAFVDAPHASAAWPSTSVFPVPEKLARRTREEKFVDIPAEHRLAVVGGSTLQGTLVGCPYLCGFIANGGRF
jgi:dihydroxyacetone kinase